MLLNLNSILILSPRTSMTLSRQSKRPRMTRWDTMFLFALFPWHGLFFKAPVHHFDAKQIRHTLHIRTIYSQIKSVITILGTFSAIAFTISRFAQMSSGGGWIAVDCSWGADGISQQDVILWSWLFSLISITFPWKMLLKNVTHWYSHWLFLRRKASSIRPALTIHPFPSP